MANSTTTATQTPVRTYKLGGRAKKLFKVLPSNKSLTNAEIIELGLKQKGNDEGYIKYMIGSMRAKGFLKMTKGKLFRGDGTVPVSVISRRKANA